jgi:hypothetical protein
MTRRDLALVLLATLAGAANAADMPSPATTVCAGLPLEAPPLVTVTPYEEFCPRADGSTVACDSGRAVHVDVEFQEPLAVPEYFVRCTLVNDEKAGDTSRSCFWPPEFPHVLQVFNIQNTA